MSFTKLQKNIIVLILILGAFITAFNQTIMSVGTPEVMSDLNISASTAQWLTTAYLLVNGVLVPITAFLMKRFSTKQLFISAMVLFLIGSLVCGISSTFLLILIGRMIQAIGAGIIIPLLYSAVMILYLPYERGTVMGMVSLAILVAPAIGPTIAGYVMDLFSWQILFILLVPLSILIIVFSVIYLQNLTETIKDKIDYWSIIQSTIAFSLILYGFSSAGDKGWNNMNVILPLIIGSVTMLLFVMRQLKSNDPFLNLKTFKYGMFSLGNIINIGVTMILYADMILLPIYLQNVQNYTAMEIGLFLLPGAILMAVMSPIMGKAYDKYGAKWITIAGVIITILSTIPFTNLEQSTDYYYLLIASTIRRMAMAMLLTPIQTAALNQIPHVLSSHGSAIWNTIRQVAGAIGTSLLVTIMAMNSKQFIKDFPTDDNITFSKEQLNVLSTVYGINAAYTVIVIVAIMSLVLSFFINDKKQKHSISY